MEESFSIPPEECGDSELDPRIQLELEKLNTATAEINKLELELDESNTTFRMLLNEATRRLKGLATRLGGSVERARPYHEAAAVAASARAACQRAAVNYQTASEIHAAAKETVASAEKRFAGKEHEGQFDNAWQEMLNYATIKVMDAENQKSESGREHMKKAQLFNAAETKLQQLEEQLRKHVIKSRAYFQEKQLCQEQLATQKGRIEQLQQEVSRAKGRYARSLRALEEISEEIHRKRRHLFGDSDQCPVGPREPGVGAEKEADYSPEQQQEEEVGGLEELRRRVRRLAARPLEAGGCGGSGGDSSWEEELNSTVQRLDQMLLARERSRDARISASQSEHSSRDKLPVLRPSSLLHGHSDVALKPSDPLSQRSELFHSQPDISNPYFLFQIHSDLAPEHPDTSSSHSSFENSLEIKHTTEDLSTNLCRDNNTSPSKVSGLRQLCLSASDLEELLPGVPTDKSLNQNIPKVNETYDTKHIAFSYKVTFDDFTSNEQKNVVEESQNLKNEACLQSEVLSSIDKCVAEESSASSSGAEKETSPQGTVCGDNASNKCDNVVVKDNMIERG